MFMFKSFFTSLNKFIKRWTFIILITIIMIFYSEKMYWYIQGYSIFELIIFYAPGVFITIQFIEYYKIKNIWSLIIASVIYPLYIEGIFTGVLNTSISLLFYFIGWHSILSVIIGFYYHHKWLVDGNYRMLIISSVILGIFWGLWSVVYWSKARIDEFNMYPNAGQWSIPDFTKFVFIFAIIYIISHYLLSKVWIDDFTFTKTENFLVFLFIFILFMIQVLISRILIISLILYWVIIFYLINLYHKKHPENKNSILSELKGDIKVRNIILLLLMPIFSVIIYSLFTFIKPDDNFIDNIIYYGVVYFQTTYGFLLLVISIFKIIKDKPLEKSYS